MSDGKQTIRAVLVDDEPLARGLLREMLREHPEVEVLEECANGFEAVKVITALRPDLVFLDIQMPKLNGFEVIELLEYRPAVVFVTAYDQYALDAWDAHAVDYLLKPISQQRLGRAIEKVRANMGQGLPPMEDLRRSVAGQPEFLDRVVVKDGPRVVIIPAADIEYIKSQDDYVEIRAGGESLLKHQTIASLEASLDPAVFIRVHRSAIVNLRYIDRIEPYTKDRYVLIMKDRVEISVSRPGYKRLKERFK